MEQDKNLEESIKKIFGTFSRKSLDHLDEDEVEYKFAAAHGVQANIYVSENKGYVLLELYALTDNDDISEVIEELQDFKKNIAILEKHGYKTSEGELKHEHETTDCKAYDIEIPMERPAKLDLLLNAIYEMKKK